MLGVVSDVVATMCGVRQSQRGVMMTAIGGFGILSFGAYAQPVFNPLVWNQALYVGMGVLIVLPVLAAVAGWAVTVKQGKPSVQSPLLFAVGAALLLLLSVAAGAVFVIRPFDLHGAGWAAKGFVLPPYASGLFLLLVTTATMGAAAGLTFWAPKLFGRFAKEPLARLAALVVLLGGLVAGLPLLVYGFALQKSGLEDSAKFLNGTSAVGTAIVIVGLILGVGLAPRERGRGSGRRRVGHGPESRVGHRQPAGVGQLRRPASRRVARAAARRRPAGGCFLMAATVTEPLALPSAAPPPPTPRPRVLLVGTAFAAAASVMLFVGLIGVYLSVRTTLIQDVGTWLPQGVIVPLVQPNMMMFTLLLSVVTMQWAVSSIKNDDRTNTYLALGVTLLLAFAFLVEYGYLFSLMKLSMDSQQGVLIYALTGANIAMTIVAMVFVILMGFRSLAGQYTSRHYDGIAAAALYWHSMVAVYALIWYVVFITK